MDRESRLSLNADYLDWRKAVHERDDYTCQLCGVRGGVLCAHHIEGYRDNPAERLDVANGVTLCDEHHKTYHAIFGQRGAQAEDYELLRAFLKMSFMQECARLIAEVQ